MDFKPLKLERIIEISEIITVHYFEYDSTFVFPGESHPFWEFLCVDKGCVEVTAGRQVYLLKSGDIIFHQPNEFHALKAGIPAPNLVVISFSSASGTMDFFREKRLETDAAEREFLAAIIAEAKKSFADPLDDPDQKEIRLKEQASPASRQIIALELEKFLLHLLNRYEGMTPDASTQGSAASPALGTDVHSGAHTRDDEQLIGEINFYLLSHLAQNLTIEEIAKAHLISISRLEHLIRSHCGCGVIRYFISLKITRAKELIRDRNMNFSQIAEVLGYSSVHYFSRQFKKVTGMTPSEYSRSIIKDADARMSNKLSENMFAFSVRDML